MGLSIEENEQIAKLYEAMYKQLILYANRALQDYHLAEEAVQDAFRIACLKSDKLKSSNNPEGWITNVLKNVIRNMQDQKRIWSKYVASGLSLEQIEDETAQLDLDRTVLSDAMKKIDKEDMDLLVKVVLYRYSILEVANELGISVSACKKRVQRAKEKLKKILE